MSDEPSRRERISARIAASQARLRRETPGTAALPAPLADRNPPEKFTGLLAEYPGLAVAAGLGIGLLAGALMPKAAASRMTRRGTAFAAVVGELGLVLARQAFDRAGEAGQDGRARMGKAGAVVARKAGAARLAGMALAKKAVEAAANARR